MVDYRRRVTGGRPTALCQTPRAFFLNAPALAGAGRKRRLPVRVAVSGGSAPMVHPDRRRGQRSGSIGRATRALGQRRRRRGLEPKNAGRGPLRLERRRAARFGSASSAPCVRNSKSNPGDDHHGNHWDSAVAAVIHFSSNQKALADVGVPLVDYTRRGRPGSHRGGRAECRRGVRRRQHPLRVLSPSHRPVAWVSGRPRSPSSGPPADWPRRCMNVPPP